MAICTTATTEIIKHHTLDYWVVEKIGYGRECIYEGVIHVPLH